MNKMQKAIRELAEMDEMAVRSSPIHALHPLSKLIATVIYILVTLSFDKYDLPGIMMMVVWPLIPQRDRSQELLLQAPHCPAAGHGSGSFQSLLR